MTRTSPERRLESLYRRHAAEVYRYALMMLGSAADAEDVTERTFLNAYRALVRGERPRAPDSWLRAIAYNLCLQRFRPAERRPGRVELEDGPAELVSADHARLVDDLSRALGQIPVNQRAALLMRELDGRPIVEIASILGVSTSAVETLLFRARRGVREQLEGCLTCAEAEEAISRRLDGKLKRPERSALRAHMRECEECAHLARSLRAQRRAIKSLDTIPLPGVLAWSKFNAATAASGVASASAGVGATGGTWLVGSLASKLTGSLVSKLASAALAAVLATGAGYVAVKHPWAAARPMIKARGTLATIPRATSSLAAIVRPTASAAPAARGGSWRPAATARKRERRRGALHARSTANQPSSPPVTAVPVSDPAVSVPTASDPTVSDPTESAPAAAVPPAPVADAQGGGSGTTAPVMSALGSAGPVTPPSLPKPVPPPAPPVPLATPPVPRPTPPLPAPTAAIPAPTPTHIVS